MSKNSINLFMTMENKYLDDLDQLIDKYIKITPEDYDT